ncbi:RNA polymerase sigma-70 factor [Compostibacter hankyongensis]|uniref:RNA polymerase sigma-70 factor n=1 Tax=Compostibacter hankyongensis TaxID=1007089 RepID=A0ABP8G1N1_9BACT
MEQISASDQKAFDLLFERYRNRLFVYLIKVTKSKETSEEIVLDVFLKIWQGRTLLSEVDNFEAFLFRIARNKALDFLRWAQKRPLVQMEIWSRIQDTPAAAQTDNRILLQHAEAAIHYAVKQLSPQRKAVFLLSREHGLTYEEIATRMHISPHTVRNHLAASLQFIRNHLSSNGEMLLSLLF